jgi:hypothetical protein
MLMLMTSAPIFAVLRCSDVFRAAVLANALRTDHFAGEPEEQATPPENRRRGLRHRRRSPCRRADSRQLIDQQHVAFVLVLASSAGIPGATGPDGPPPAMKS